VRNVPWVFPIPKYGRVPAFLLHFLSESEETVEKILHLPINVALSIKLGVPKANIRHWPIVCLLDNQSSWYYVKLYWQCCGIDAWK
jgi:hypothetical protein